MKILILGSTGILGRTFSLFLSKKKKYQFITFQEVKIIKLIFI